VCVPCVCFFARARLRGGGDVTHAHTTHIHLQANKTHARRLIGAAFGEEFHLRPPAAYVAVRILGQWRTATRVVRRSEEEDSKEHIWTLVSCVVRWYTCK
jgi:hypothetical protein